MKLDAQARECLVLAVLLALAVALALYAHYIGRNVKPGRERTAHIAALAAGIGAHLTAARVL